MTKDNNAGMRPTNIGERVEAIYTPLQEAVAELQRRRIRFKEGTPGRHLLPDNLSPCQNGLAILSRYLATPNFETLRFVGLARKYYLSPLIGELTVDRYIGLNPAKRSLRRLGFAVDTCDSRPAFVNVASGNIEGSAFRDLRTSWGEDFGVFHRQLLARQLDGSPNPQVYDFSSHRDRLGSSYAFYRECLLLLGVADGIIFDDYLLDKGELSFTREVILPAFDAVTETFGMRPLVVRLSPRESAESPHWFWYPTSLKASVIKKLEAAESSTSNSGPPRRMPRTVA